MNYVKATKIRRMLEKELKNSISTFVLFNGSWGNYSVSVTAPIIGPKIMSPMVNICIDDESLIFSITSVYVKSNKSNVPCVTIFTKVEL